MQYKLPTAALTVLLGCLAQAEANNNNNVKFCDRAAQEVKQSAFAAWYSVQASPSTQPVSTIIQLTSEHLAQSCLHCIQYGTTKDVARFLDCVDLCDADRKPQNEADPDNVENASSKGLSNDPQALILYSDLMLLFSFSPDRRLPIRHLQPREEGM